MTKTIMSLIGFICLLHACDDPTTKLPSTGGTQEDLEAGIVIIVVSDEAMAGEPIAGEPIAGVNQ